MKINEYYRDTAKARLNGSIAALIPAIIIISGNLSYFQNKLVMVGCVPFIIYSLISFQIYLFRLNQSIAIGKNMSSSLGANRTIFDESHLLLVYFDLLSPSLLLFFSNGYLAGKITKYKKGKRIFQRNRDYVLLGLNDDILAIFRVKGRKKIKIEAFTKENEYLGCYEKTKKSILRKSKKELLDSSGRFVGAVEGSALFMDEQIYNNQSRRVGRLRRGWMPLEWSNIFPEPNTPVLSFWEGFSEKDKLLRMAMLINEYFIER